MAGWSGLQVRIRSGEGSNQGPMELIGRKPALHDGEPEYRLELRNAQHHVWTAWESDCEYVGGGKAPTTRREELDMAAKSTASKPRAKSAAKKSAAKAPARKAAAKKAPAKKATARKAPAANVDKAKRDERILKLHEQGNTLASIGEDVGMSGMGVYNVLKRHGVKGK